MNPVKRGPVDNGFAFAFEPLAAMMNLAEIDAVLEKIGEGTIGEGNAAIVFGDLGVALLGDDAPVVEFAHQLAERL